MSPPAARSATFFAYIENMSSENLEVRVAGLEQDIKVLTEFITILWKTKGPAGNFLCYFSPGRFRNQAEVEAHLQKSAPTSRGVIAAEEDGILQGYAFFTCDNPLDALALGKVEWSPSGQHDVILK